MAQILGQWTGSEWIKHGDWLPEEMRSVGESAINVSKEFEFNTPSGQPVETVTNEETASFQKLIVYSGIGFIMAMAVFSLVVLIKSGNSKISGRFFDDSTLYKIIILTAITSIMEGCRSISIISPEYVKLAVICDYLYNIPMIMLLAMLLSRMYRFNKVTNNRRMKTRRFSKHHNLYWTLIAVCICLPAIVIRILSNNSHIDGDESLLEKTYTLQDDDPRYTYVLTQPIYDLYNEYRIVTGMWLAFGPLYRLVLCLTLAFLSNMARSDQVKKTNGNLAKEMSLMQRTSLACCVGLSIEVINNLLKQVISNEEPTSHVGFENGDCRAELKDMQMVSYMQIFLSVVFWLSFMYIVYVVRLKKFITNTTTKSSVSGSIVSNNSTSLDLHPLSDDMLVRLKMTRIETTFINENGTDSSEARHGTSLSSINKNKSQGKCGSTVTTQTQVTQVGTLGGRVITSTGGVDQSQVFNNTNSFADFSTNSVKTTESHFVNLPVLNTATSDMAWSAKSRRDSSLEPLNPEKFLSELGSLSHESFKILLSKLETDLKKYSASCGRMCARFYELEDKLDAEILKLEVNLVRMRRFKIKSAYVPSSSSM
eukprot:TRINITY_DN3544_c1_g4_i1.p1 TRINITY_DN3544_c1_g4~~TRINITY_DN3544_c1_g4_i1.p1  ORF type:complete len:595 (-),score=119.60 TRINITY_DN3544_c1_g4_i1:303-2087(-)